MDALITFAWRTFWVGLGASAVLIAQNLVSPPASPRAESASAAEPTVQVSAPAMVRTAVRNAS